MKKKISHYVGLLILGVWTLSSLALGAAMMALHAPLADPNLSAISLASLTRSSNLSDGKGSVEGSALTKLTAVHFIAEKCGCSAAVAKHLLERGRLNSLQAEHVVLIGSTEFAATEFENLGFTVSAIDSQDLHSRFGIDTAPLMLLRKSDGVIAYLGGYYTSFARTKNLDSEIVERVIAGEFPKPFPSFGCAQSAKYRKAQDPFGLKYRQSTEKLSSNQ